MWGGIYAGIAQCIRCSFSLSCVIGKLILLILKIGYMETGIVLKTTIIRVNKAGKQIWRLDARSYEFISFTLRHRQDYAYS